MNEQTLTTLLERAGERTAVGPAPLEEIARGAHRRQRRRNLTLTFTAVAAVVVVVFGATLAHGVDRAGHPGQVATHDGVDPATWQRLEKTVEQAAGQDPIQSAQAVKSYHSAAVRVTSEDLVPGHQAVWAIQIEGVHTFVSEITGPPTAPGQPAPPPPSGRFMTLVVDATSFQVLDWGIQSDRVDLSRLGTVITLNP